MTGHDFDRLAQHVDDALVQLVALRRACRLQLGPDADLFMTVEALTDAVTAMHDTLAAASLQRAHEDAMGCPI